jgi:hypothetical protein
MSSFNMTPKDNTFMSPKSVGHGSVKESKMIGFDPSNSPQNSPKATGRQVTELRKD